MDLKQQVRIWIEENLGKKISKDLKKMVKEEDSTFDVEAYIDNLCDSYFSNGKIELMKKEIFENYHDKSYDSDNSSQVDYFSQELFEFEPGEFQPFSGEEIIKNLRSNSKEVRIKCLRQLGSYAEDLISLASWNVIKNLLQNFLKTNNDGEINTLTLKVFQRLLFCYNKPQIVCESFTSVSEIFFFHLQTINSENGNVILEEFYDLKTNKLLDKKTGSRKVEGSKLQKHLNAELSVKLLFQLVECQKQMPEKWIRFSEKRLREIIFGFVNLLSSTTNSESETLSGLELLSILSPTATWSRHWCHTSTGRLLLCAALRKHKQFFLHIIRNVVVNVKARRTRHLQTAASGRNYARLPSANNELQQLTVPSSQSTSKIDKENYNANERQKCVRSAPNLPANASKTANCEFLIGNIPRAVAEQALLCHNVSLVACLVQYRSGRSLFPLQIQAKKRLLSVQDLISSLIGYLENFDGDANASVNFTQAYREHVSNVVEELKSVQTILSARGPSAQRLEFSRR